MQALLRDQAAAARSGVTLRELEVLLALVECGRTTGAARRLGLSQPAVSRALASLEAGLGYLLFERTRAGLVPTMDALAIADELQVVFATLARIEKRGSAERGSFQGALRIAAPPTIAHRFLPSRVALFVREHPGLEVTFDVLSSDALITSVAEGRHDLGLTDTVPAHEGVRTQTLIETEAICLLPAGHPLVDRTIVRPQDLEGAPFVALMRRHSSRAAMDRVFEHAGVRRRIVIETATVWRRWSSCARGSAWRSSIRFRSSISSAGASRHAASLRQSPAARPSSYPPPGRSPPPSAGSSP